MGARMSEVVHSARQGAKPDAATGDARAEPGHPVSDMVRIPGGDFQMGSDRHYPEEASRVRISPGRTRS